MVWLSAEFMPMTVRQLSLLSQIKQALPLFSAIISPVLCDLHKQHTKQMATNSILSISHGAALCRAPSRHLLWILFHLLNQHGFSWWRMTDGSPNLLPSGVFLLNFQNAHIFFFSHESSSGNSILSNGFLPLAQWRFGARCSGNQHWDLIAHGPSNCGHTDKLNNVLKTLDFLLQRRKLSICYCLLLVIHTQHLLVDKGAHECVNMWVFSLKVIISRGKPATWAAFLFWKYWGTRAQLCSSLPFMPLFSFPFK